jgi:hypothetical protein
MSAASCCLQLAVELLPTGSLAAISGPSSIYLRIDTCSDGRCFRLLLDTCTCILIGRQCSQQRCALVSTVLATQLSVDWLCAMLTEKPARNRQGHDHAFVGTACCETLPESQCTICVAQPPAGHACRLLTAVGIGKGEAGCEHAQHASTESVLSDQNAAS